MKKRSISRENALIILYQIDLIELDKEKIIESFWAEKDQEQSIKEFSMELIRGVLEYFDIIDEKIKKYSDNWNIKRMAYIDRNILRLGIFELFYLEGIPYKVTINEYIELGKKYGEKDSGRFINGILDQIFKKGQDDLSDKS